MGLKNKIRLGFLSLALLLFFSGIISYFELSRLSHSTHSMLGASFRNMELSKTMLDAVQDQNTALLQMIVSGSRNSDSMLIVGRQKFDSSMREANVLIRDLQGFDSIYAANVAYNRIVDAYLSDSLHKNSVGWYVNMLIVGMAFFSLGTDVSMTPMGEGIGAQLPKTKNLAVVIAITLLIGILIVVVFFYFINLYYISPVLKITDALKNYLNSKIPFKVNVEGRDEMFRLKESIEKLIDQQKSKRNE
mgnify:CR=1 FL=1